MAQYLSYEGLQKYDTKIKEWTQTNISNGIAQLINSAPEEFDTLKEVSDWIQEQKALNSEVSTKLESVPDVEAISSDDIDTLFNN